jgi:hypothetical protein
MTPIPTAAMPASQISNTGIRPPEAAVDQNLRWILP